MKNIYLSIVIPVFNEAENLKELYQRLMAVLGKLNKSSEIIFIDDGSTDESFAVLSNLAEQDERVKIIQFRKNFGQTNTLAAGIDWARGEVIIPMDADLENDPQDIPKLLEELGRGYDIVSGWRKQRWSNRILSRRITSWAANWLISKIVGLKLHDYGCTLKAYRREIIKDVELYGEMHRFIPALAYWQGAEIKEIEVNYRPRQFGQSKYGLGRTFKVLLDLVTLKFLSGYATKPIYFFGKIGFVSLFFGFLVFLWATYYKLTGQKDYIETPLPVVVALFVILAVLLILIGLLAEMIMRTYHQSKGKKIYSIKRKVNF
jgi:glycosyltransferase involved in cell wall biosynthesis